jgi:aldehyde dehydrogenase (NAD+)
MANDAHHDSELFIGGESRKGARTAPNVNPATGETIGSYAMGTVDDVKAAVAAAKAAQPAWRKMPAPRRGAILAKAATWLTEHLDHVAATLTAEEGKTLSEARGEVQKAINVLEFTAGEGRRLNGETIPSELPSTFIYTQRQPLGVVAAVTPWNFPICIPAWKIAPALVAGNTVVFKPASLTPATAAHLVTAFHDSGLPPGVLNLVTGSGGLIGDALVAHPDVAAVSFTGSNEVGSRLYAEAAKSGKKVLCEMGGKNALVVLEDADLALAAEAAAQGAFGSTGQRCTATSRLVVVESVADRFAELVVEKARALKVGDGSKPGVQMGPVVDQNQLDTVMGFVAVGKKDNRLLCGGERLAPAGCEKGLFVAPTVFDHVKPDDKLAQEEVFGPVLSIIRVKDFEQALEVANGARYGLSASLYTRDLVRAQLFADEIDVGIVHINNPTVGGEAQAPFGGLKATGIGGREMGKTAIEFFTEWKTVYVDYTGRKRDGNLY